MTEKFEHKKSLGQHFLNSDYASKKMCDAADVQAGDMVLEIGPGTGMLTKEILARGARVVAVEADRRAVTALEETCKDAISSGQLIVHHRDARNLDPTEFDLANQHFKVVSNIPYYISNLLFRQLLDADCQPNTLVFLVQKEVAERITRSEKESLLSLSIKIFGDPTYICTIKKGHFTPPPKVDSAILAVNQISKIRLSAVKSEHFFHLIRLGFAQKRKQLIGNFSNEFERQDLEIIFTRLGLSLKVRAEDIPLEKWIDLTKELYSGKK